MLPPGLAAALAPGTVIGGKYRLEQPLGAGGMGVVLAARHLELNQNLAIKVLLPNVASSQEAVTRFLREGRSAAQLTSPHVAKVHDAGRLPSGAPFLVMELLHGRDLRAHLAEVGHVPLAQAIEWTLQTAHALSEAHTRNIIHRDVKPANLFLADTSAGQQIKVLDFGVSKQLDSLEADLTKTTSAVGTPRYMAPEQMRSPRLGDARGDIWSLGIVLYELTTGQSPFHGDSVTALCFDVMERTPVSPSQLNPLLPTALDEIVLRCLEKDPNDRFQSMTALATALSALAPAARSSGLFTAVTGSTPAAPLSTPGLAGQPRTEPLAHPLFPEMPPQETMRSWDTTAVPRSREKKPSRIPLIGLGIAIGVGVAALVGFLIGNREPSSSNPASSQAAPLQSVTSAMPTAIVSAEPTVVVVVAPPPPEVSSAPEPVASAVPSAKVTKPSGCENPYVYDKVRKIQTIKPWCNR
jgi:serine/threonine protein kinase